MRWHSWNKPLNDSSCRFARWTTRFGVSRHAGRNADDNTTDECLTRESVAGAPVVGSVVAPADAALIDQWSGRLTGKTALARCAPIIECVAGVERTRLCMLSPRYVHAETEDCATFGRLGNPHL